MTRKQKNKLKKQNLILQWTSFVVVVGLVIYFILVLLPELKTENVDSTNVFYPISFFIGGIIAYVLHEIGERKINRVKAYKISLKRTREIFHAQRFYNALSDNDFDKAMNIIENNIRTNMIANQLQGVILGFEIARTNGHEVMIDVGMRIVKKMI